MASRTMRPGQNSKGQHDTAEKVSGVEEILALDGRDLGYPTWRTVTQRDIDACADVSGDHQWVHTDVEKAAAGPYGACCNLIGLVFGV